MKRKRKNDSDEDDGDDTSGSEAINLPQLSSSGRRITQASTFVPPVISLDPPAPSTVKKVRTTTRATDPVPVFLTGAMKRKHARNPSEAAVCRNCGRGHSPNSNQIVFCDGCNTPWHQFCHDRPITPTVIEIEDKEWRCADCEIDVTLANIAKGRVNAEALAQATGIDHTLKWKQDYLLSLPKDTLVGLLLKAHEANEELPLFEPSPKYGVFVSSSVPILEEGAEREASNTEKTAASGPRSDENQAGPREHDGEAAAALEEDEGYYEEPLPYPKMGNGLTLPPEEDDYGILVDENELTYSHSWQEDAQWKGTVAQEDMFVGGTCNLCHERTFVEFKTQTCSRCVNDSFGQADVPSASGSWVGD